MEKALRAAIGHLDPPSTFRAKWFPEATSPYIHDVNSTQHLVAELQLVHKYLINTLWKSDFYLDKTLLANDVQRQLTLDSMMTGLKTHRESITTLALFLDRLLHWAPIVDKLTIGDAPTPFSLVFGMALEDEKFLIYAVDVNTVAMEYPAFMDLWWTSKRLMLHVNVFCVVLAIKT
jgi:hypothetical protein